MSRVLGIDYGSVRIGVAISDPMGLFARGIRTIPNKQGALPQIIEELLDLIKLQEVSEIVVGLPRRTDGKVSESEIAAREFGTTLQAAAGLPLTYFDERFTTVIAHQILNASAKKRNSQVKRQVVDQIAAEIILQNYLDSRR